MWLNRVSVRALGSGLALICVGRLVAMDICDLDHEVNFNSVRPEIRSEIEQFKAKIKETRTSIQTEAICDLKKTNQIKGRILQMIAACANEQEKYTLMDVLHDLYEVMVVLRVSLESSQEKQRNLISELFHVDEDVFGPVEPNPAWAHVKVILPKAEEA